MCEDVYTDTQIYVDVAILTDYIQLYPGGRLWCKKGYAWDGPSSACRWIADRLPGWLKNKYLKTILEGSLFHDGIYQLIRLGLLAPKWREQGDKEFKRINLGSGMGRARAWWTYQAVRRGGASSADPKNKRLVLTSP